MDIDFYYQDPEYVTKYLVSIYFQFLNNTVNILRSNDIQTNNHDLHEIHKELFSPEFSLKDEQIELDKLVEFLNQVESYWNNKIGLTFMP